MPNKIKIYTAVVNGKPRENFFSRKEAFSFLAGYISTMFDQTPTTEVVETEVTFK